jgi:hypothetical protein
MQNYRVLWEHRRVAPQWRERERERESRARLAPHGRQGDSHRQKDNYIWDHDCEGVRLRSLWPQVLELSLGIWRESLASSLKVLGPISR